MTHHTTHNRTREQSSLARFVWPVAAVAAPWLYWFYLRPRHLQWGATDVERLQPLSGDELVARPKMAYTHAITIHAPAATVWAWLVQIGQGRGGFYSYDWLENLFGCDIHSAARIRPELQRLAVGDLVRLGPEGYPYYQVALVEPESALVLHNKVDTKTGRRLTHGDELQPAAYVNSSWAFALDAVDEQTTRLLVRGRTDYNPGLANEVLWRVLTEPASFIMERGMLLGLKQRAER